MLKNLKFSQLIPAVVFLVGLVGSIVMFIDSQGLSEPSGKTVDVSQYVVRLVRCVNGIDAFESTQDTDTCEVRGQRYVGPLGYIFKVNVQGTHPLYRCAVRAREAMASVDSDCENVGRGAIQNNKFIGRIGYVYSQQQPGTVPLFRCLRGADHFLSIRDDCEGSQKEGIVGYLFSKPPELCKPKCTSACGGEADGCGASCPILPSKTSCVVKGRQGTCDEEGYCITIPFCEDTDAGDDYARAGTVTTSRAIGVDTCTGDSLVEYVCKDKELDTRWYDCSGSGCKDGACSTATVIR